MITNEEEEPEEKAMGIEQSQTGEESSESSSNNPTTIDSLPIEVLIKIFQYIRHPGRFCLERVCKKWQTAARDSWRDWIGRFTIGRRWAENRHGRHGIANESYVILKKIVSRCGKYITSFNYYDWPHKNFPYVLPIINEYCYNIESLNLSLMDQIDVEGWSELFKINKKLHSLRCRYSTYSINYHDCEGNIIELIKNSHSLEAFGTDHWSSDLVEELSKHQSLKTLYISQWLCHQSELLFALICKLGPTSSEDFLIDFPDDLSQHCKNLTKLVLRGPELTMTTLEMISSFHQLETLILDYMIVKDDVLIHLNDYKNLHLSFTHGYTENGFLEMIKKSERLEKLYIASSKVTPRMFIKLVNEIREREELIEVFVKLEIQDEVTEICEGTKIKIVKDLKL